MLYLCYLRIQLTAIPKCVDPVIPDMDLSSFQKPFIQKTHDATFREADEPRQEERNHDGHSLTSIDSGIGVMNSENSASNSPNIEHTDNNKSNSANNDSSQQPMSNRERLGSTVSDFIPVGLDVLDNHTGVLHVWFLVLDGLTNTVSNCPKNYQPQTLEVLFSLLRSAATTPGK